MTRAAERGVVMAIGLAIAGAASPVAATAIAGTSGLLGPPLAASALLALLGLVPAGVGLAAALTGMRALVARGDGDAEHAILRVFVDTLLFGYALGLAALTSSPGPAPYVMVAALALIIAWAVLLHLIVWPAVMLWRRFAAMALDVVLFSTFLHFGGSGVADWYPLYLLAVLYAGLRFGRGALLATGLASVAGFAAVVLSTDFWLQQPVLAVGLLGALAVLPRFIARTIRAPKAAPTQGVRANPERDGLFWLIGDTERDKAAAAPVDDIGDVPSRAVRQPATAVDAGTIDQLRALGGGPDFLTETLEAFRADARRILDQIDAAVAAGNVAAVMSSLAILRRIAGQLGGTQLCDLVAALQGLGEGEWRRHGAIHTRRLEEEAGRLIAALSNFLPTDDVARR